MRKKKETVTQNTMELVSPLSGKVVVLSEVKDEVFSQKILGDGIAVCPTKGLLCAPADGQIEQVFDSKHAITMTTSGGAELLLHIGIDTVALKGRYFEVKVKDGDTVHKGDTLAVFDMDGIRSAGYDVTTPMIVSNSDVFEQCVLAEGEIVVGTPILRLSHRTEESEGRI